MIPMVEEAAVTAAVKSRGYPRSIIAGINTPPTAAVSAIDEPEMPAKSMLVNTFTAASPPWMWPTMADAKSTSRSDMPDSFIRLPARMKRGAARRGKLSAPR